MVTQWFIYPHEWQFHLLSIFVWLSSEFTIGMVDDQQKHQFPSYHRFSYTPSMLAVERGCVLFRPWLMGPGVVSIALCLLYAVVSCPHPTPKRRKGSGTHQALFGSCWLGMSEFCCTNQSCAMWLICDYNVILHYSQLLLLMRAVDALLCQSDALSWQSHDDLHPVRPRKRSMCTRPFPPNWLSWWSVLHIHAKKIMFSKVMLF